MSLQKKIEFFPKEFWVHLNFTKIDQKLSLVPLNLYHFYYGLVSVFTM